MNRRLINFIRWILEDVIPPVLRDSRLFYLLLFLVFKKRTSYYAQFRSKSPFLTLEQYAEYYRDFPHLMEGTDLNDKCLRRILTDLMGAKVLDAGCGRGVLCEEMAKSTNHQGNHEVTRQVSGIDVTLSDDLKNRKNIEFREGFLEKLPYGDKSFDTVVCTHTLEHVLDFEKCLAELKRVARLRLIIVVPREREYKYAFNLHLHFFPYVHSFLRQVKAGAQSKFQCEILDGDIYYCEDLI
jgi:ubiquinone/menaquinone biosynthesis C-methylase UbiE